MALAFEGASWTSEYAFPLMLMQTIIGSWDRTSPLGRNTASKLAQGTISFVLGTTNAFYSPFFLILSSPLLITYPRYLLSSLFSFIFQLFE